MAEELSVVGKNLPRKDAREKVTGEVKFVADIQLPRMLHVQFLRSPYAHAKITKIDTSRAEALPGVKCVLTHKNTPKVHPLDKFEFLLDETVHVAGEEVAAVAAETEEIAKEALKLIDVEYEVLPAVFDAEEAIKPDAPVVHVEHGSNLYFGLEKRTDKSYGPKEVRAPRTRADGYLPLEVGDVDKGFAEADAIIEGRYESPMQACVSPMPRAVICQWNGNNLNCWADSQVPQWINKDLARCLGMPQSSIRVMNTTSTVGGYGAKTPEKVAIINALIAKKTGRPVKAVYTREEEFVATHHRPSYVGYEKIGVKKDGTITAMQHRMIGNFGRDFFSATEIMSASAAATSGTLYMYQNLKFEGCVAITNVPDTGPMNGLGDPEAGFIVERAVDEAAEAIGMDPVEFRLKNCARYGSRSVSRRDVLGLSHDELELRPDWVNWGIVGPDFDSLPECIKIVRDKSGWKKWKGWKAPVEVNGTKRKGIGIAIGMHMSCFRLYSAIIKMNWDGTANVLSSAAEIGQGIRTAMAQVVAETLGIGYEDVEILLGDSAATPEGWGCIASGGTSSAIPAAWHAAKEIKRKLFDIAAPRLGVTPDELEAKNRMIYVKYKPEKCIPIAEACLRGYQVTGAAVNPSPDSIIDEKTGKVMNTYACVATIAEVEVDTETGKLDVLKLSSAHDCGRAINPQMVENQIDMGLVQANGYGRSEEMIFDKDSGVMLNPDLLDYKLMTILDMPKMDDMQDSFVEYPSAWGAFGSKGFSETGATSGAPAVANAVYNAIGVRIRGEHITPDAILEALGK